MKKIVRIVSLGLAVCLFVLILCSCGALGIRTDEQKIRDRVNTFATALNAGDAETAIECLDSKSRNLLNAALSIGEGLLGTLIGIKINVQDLFALAMNLTGSLFDLDIQDVEITSDTTAIVYLTATTRVNGAVNSDQGALELVKESGDWYLYFRMDLSSLLK